VIVDRLQAIDSPVMLDIGCGPGQLAAFLRDRGLTEYVGLDFSSKRIEWARSSVPEVRFELTDVYESDLLESLSYNTVICTEFLEHVERDLEVLHRLRSGARFIGTVPNFGGGSHVRHFRDAGEVSNRYGSCFEVLRVETFSMPQRNLQHFLLDGIVASARVPQHREGAATTT
jgi:trans-aconitate methyltransferase